MTQPSTRRRPQGPTGSTRRTAGFTLIELMIAVAIVGILASIAYPSYQRYITESRRTDAKALLMTAAGDLERCYTRINNYEQCFDDLNLDGRKSENEFYEIIEPHENDLNPFSYMISAEPQGVQAARDTACGTFTFTHTGERKPDGCW